MGGSAMFVVMDQTPTIVTVGACLVAFIMGVNLGFLLWGRRKRGK